MDRKKVCFILMPMLLLNAFSGCAKNEPVKYFGVTFDGNGGTLISGDLHQKVSNASEIKPPVFELNGFVFIGWDIPINSINEPANIKAQWKIKSYKINYHLDGGINNSLNPSWYNISQDSFSLFNASKDGYSFNCWTLPNGTPISEINTASAKDYDLYASYNANGYSITYELDGGHFISPAPYSYTASTETHIPDAEKNGYKFEGWSLKPNASKGTKNYAIKADNYGDIKLYAIYSPNSYKVTYDANGGVLDKDTDEFLFGNGYRLKIPHKDGYEFAGWALNGVCVDQEGVWTSESDIELVAQWNLSSYSITYILNGGTNNELNKNCYTYEDEDYLLSEPIKKGYSFVGWDDGSGIPVKNYVIKNKTFGPIILEANWQPNTYKVHLDVNTGDPLDITEYQFVFDEAIELPIPTKDKYVFSGWFYVEESVFVSDKWTISSDATLIAKWTAEEYEINYVLNGGTNHPLNPAGYNYEDDTITILPASREGYSFLGWNTEDDCTLYNSIIIEHNSFGTKTLYANWEVNDYEITYDLAGGTGIDFLNEIIVFDTEHVSPIPSKNGYSFAGWYCDDIKVDDGIWKISRDCVLVAHWQPNEYSITKIYNEQECQTVFFGEDYNLGVVDKDGYCFAGWYSETNGSGIRYTDEAGNSLNPYDYTEDRTVYAGFVYEITFVTNGGVDIPKLSLRENECFTDEIIAEKENRTFGGWFVDPELTQPVSFSQPLSSIVLYAKWLEELEPSKITYLLNNDNTIRITKVNSDDSTIILPSHIGGLPVKTIAYRAFLNKTNLVSVEIPTTVTSLSHESFSGCNSIVDITLPFIGRDFPPGSSDRSFNVFGAIFGQTRVGARVGGGEERTHLATSAKYDYTGQGPSFTSNIYPYIDEYFNVYYIPETIRHVTISVSSYIPNWAFDNCDLIETITFLNPKSFEGIGAFDNCNAVVTFL